jgi:formylglycine-generating enzyme required for sulfatase activity
VLLPGGQFYMGSQSRNPGRPNYDPDVGDRSLQWAMLGPFFLSKYEMTRVQWSMTMRLAPSFLDQEPPRPYPVVNMTWDESKTAVWRLGLGMQTEAQWEYAARGGDLYSFVVWRFSRVDRREECRKPLRQHGSPS